MARGPVLAKSKVAQPQSNTRLAFLPVLPKPGRRGQAVFDPAHTLLIYDERLPRVSRAVASWIRKFPHRYPVASGEKLKDVRRLPAHVEKLAKISAPLSPRTMTVVALGGGSVGDFAGFFASIFKRGVRLVHIPSTWLAAIDSSHGGKTALNVAGAKNQIGTFYPADAVVLVREVLRAQPEERVKDAMGEFGKVALLDGGAWVRDLERSRLNGEDLLWKFLKPAIESKLKVVARDPKEQTGHRQILNLGHTVGHVIEAALGVSHGVAVGQGLFFALEFSERLGLISSRDMDRALRLLSTQLGLTPELPRKPIAASRFKDLLLQDKKKSGRSDVTFIFLRGFGKPERRSVPIRELVDEGRRQGWVAK